MDEADCWRSPAPSFQSFSSANNIDPLGTRIEKTPTNKTQIPRPKPDKTKPKTETRQERIEDVRKRERDDLERE
jgi:hypothetical protein